MADVVDDLLVVGGGPVGLATALYAARAGLRVSVVERRPGPVDKACGEGLMPGAVAALRHLEVDLVGAPIEGITYVGGQRRVTARFRHGTGLGVRRTTLHAALAQAAGRAGIATVPGVVVGLRQDASGVVVALRDGVERRARHVVAADGLHSTVRGLIGAGPAGPAAPAPGRRHGLRRHYAVAPWSSTVEVHWADRAEAYVTPVADDVVGIAVLTREVGSLDTLLAGFPDLLSRLTGAAPASEVRGAAPLDHRTRRRVVGRVLLVGDASGYVDALTGEGIAVGLAQARQAVAAVVADDAASYERGWASVTRRPDALTRGLLTVTRPAWGRRAIVPLACAVPALFGGIVNEIARPPKELA